MTFNQENGTDSCKGGNRVTTLFLWKLSPCFREIIKRLFYITSLQSWLKESEKQDLVLWVCQRRKYNYSIVTILSTVEFNLCVWNKNIFFRTLMKISLNRVFWILFQLKGALILIPKSLLSDFRHKTAQQERSFPLYLFCMRNFNPSYLLWFNTNAQAMFKLVSP